MRGRAFDWPEHYATGGKGWETGRAGGLGASAMFGEGRWTMSQPVLYGFGPSVYTWAARLALRLKGVAFEVREVNPFDPAQANDVRALHPFGRVPVLGHGSVRIYETSAILTYVDGAFEGPLLAPLYPLARARMVQVQAIVDGYGYWPMVRQVYVHGVARGAEGSAEDLAAGLAASAGVLDALEEVAAEGVVLGGAVLSLADAHLYPMVDYFQRHEEAAEMLDTREALAAWYAAISECAEVPDTRPAVAV